MTSQFTAAVRRYFNTEPVYHVDEFLMFKSVCKPPVEFITKQTTPIQPNTTHVILIQLLPLDYVTCFSPGISTQNIQKKIQ